MITSRYKPVRYPLSGQAAKDSDGCEAEQGRVMLCYAAAPAVCAPQVAGQRVFAVHVRRDGGGARPAADAVEEGAGALAAANDGVAHERVAALEPGNVDRVFQHTCLGGPISAS